MPSFRMDAQDVSHTLKFAVAACWLDRLSGELRKLREVGI
jgi:hypothetical protein